MFLPIVRVNVNRKYQNKYDLHYLIVEVVCQFGKTDKPVSMDSLPLILDAYYDLMAEVPDNRYLPFSKWNIQMPEFKKGLGKSKGLRVWLLTYGLSMENNELKVELIFEVSKGKHDKDTAITIGAARKLVKPILEHWQEQLLKIAPTNSFDVKYELLTPREFDHRF